MNALTIESLGLSKDDIADRVVDRVVDQLLHNLDDTDEDGNPTGARSQFQDQMRERIKAKIDASVDEVAAKHILPNITAYLETLVMQETNSWGEKKGAPVTFIEYLTQRAEVFMVEPVDHEGKSKRENSRGSWTQKGTRVAYMMDRHLQYSIEHAMKAALANANSQISGGIVEVVKLKLAEVVAGLKVQATIGK